MCRIDTLGILSQIRYSVGDLSGVQSLEKHHTLASLQASLVHPRSTSHHSVYFCSRSPSFPSTRPSGAEIRLLSFHLSFNPVLTSIGVRVVEYLKLTLRSFIRAHLNQCRTFKITGHAYRKLFPSSLSPLHLLEYLHSDGGASFTHITTPNLRDLILSNITNESGW
ncbi:hypothetical protein BDV98DRAFT_573559, partial [Pterulicium gracile]